MQLRPEPNPAFTSAQSVEHSEVILPAVGVHADTQVSAEEGNPFGQPRDPLADKWASQGNIGTTLRPLAIPRRDDAYLNKAPSDVARTVGRTPQPFDEVRAAPIAIWEGEVKSVDNNARMMYVYLRSKLGKFEDHSAEISLEWVTMQDQDLVQPGAVFYWTLYKETRRGSIKNSQELRFRRLPNWSRSLVDRIREESNKLFLQQGVARVLEESGG